VSGLPSDIKELVRSRTDLIALVGESVALHSQRGGRMFKALCPFHDDHNPSMEVNPERQTYRCWVCNKGGDCFSWVMEYEGVGFREALVSLANRAGVEIPKYQGHRDEGPTVNDKSSLYEVMAWAETEFHRFLLNAAQAERAREYLRSRHFSKATIEEYRLGYHPDSWEWIQERARNKFSQEQLLAARLIQERDKGNGYYDLFLDRVLFPIQDERGRCVAFGGRQLPDSKYNSGGKYFNSPEGILFHKSKLIFGLNKARDAIRKTGTAVVMEGYVDCIKAHQAGVLNAVATLGTALTEQHVAFLKRLAERVVLVYDGDDAGQKAAVKAVEKFLAQDVDLRVLTLPENLDPDEFLDAHGTDAFE
jgi:DNA primase